MKITKTQPTIWIIALLTIAIPGAAGAQDGDAPEADLSKSSYMAARHELWDLKENDPEAFRAKISELRKSAQKRLDDLKESDPDAYDRVIERRQKRIQPRFDRFREENPEAYERMEMHRAGLIQKQTAWFREHDPAKLEQIRQRRDDFLAKRAAQPEWQETRGAVSEKWQESHGAMWKKQQERLENRQDWRQANFERPYDGSQPGRALRRPGNGGPGDVTEPGQNNRPRMRRGVFSGRDNG